jgi:hypothetical protein
VSVTEWRNAQQSMTSVALVQCSRRRIAAAASTAAPAATAAAVATTSHVSSMFQSMIHPRSIPAPIDPCIGMSPEKAGSQYRTGRCRTLVVLRAFKPAQYWRRPPCTAMTWINAAEIETRASSQAKQPHAPPNACDSE